MIIEQGKLSGVLSKCGYRAGPVEDGPGIYHHDWSLPVASILVSLHHSAYMPYMLLESPVTIDGVVVYEDYDLQDAAVIPQLLLATLAEHLQRMQEKAKA